MSKIAPKTSTAQRPDNTTKKDHETFYATIIKHPISNKASFNRKSIKSKKTSSVIPIIDNPLKLSRELKVQTVPRHLRRMRIQLHTTEQGRKNQNQAAEREIGVLAKRWKLRMAKKKVPQRLWDHGLVCEGELLSRTAQ